MSFPTSYISFLIANRRFLTFGLLLTFGSSFGQTFFISLFSADIRHTFDLSHGEFGTLYAAATLASAATLIWLGRKVDDIDLRLFTLFVTLGLGTACLLMAWSPSIFILGLAIYTLRLFGQGLMGHTSATAMARYFERSRGTALSISVLGYPLGEALFPYTAVSLLGFFSTGQTWGIIALVIFILITPLTQVLLIGHQERHERHIQKTSSRTEEGPSRSAFSRQDVLRGRNFYVILSVILAPAFITTGIFFHQVHIIDIKGWELSLFAASYVAFAISQLSSSLLTGPTIDRSDALHFLPWLLTPLLASLIVLASFDARIAIVLFMVFAGATSGALTTVAGALWAEIYGVIHLGAIKAMATALMVLATALSPAILGWMIDGGVSIDAILYAMALYVAAASLFARVWFRNGVR